MLFWCRSFLVGFIALVSEIKTVKMWPTCWILPAVFCALHLLLSELPVARALQCYNCRGITNYDPNACFNPTYGKTVMQECAKTEVCEKRVTMVDRLQDVIDRGCSSNCNGRKFIWTDEFQVYCCDDKSFCNGAPSGRIIAASSVLLMSFFALIPWALRSLFTVAVWLVKLSVCFIGLSLLYYHLCYVDWIVSSYCANCSQ